MVFLQQQGESERDQILLPCFLILILNIILLRYGYIFVRYIFKNNRLPLYKRKKKLISFTKITLLIPFFLLFQYNCSKKETISEAITETIFVTKKDAFLYGDVLDRNIIDEIPAFVKIKTKEKITLISKSDDDKIYYKTKFKKSIRQRV